MLAYRFSWRYTKCDEENQVSKNTKWYDLPEDKRALTCRCCMEEQLLPEALNLGWCRNCCMAESVRRKAYNRRYYRDNREKFRAYQKRRVNGYATMVEKGEDAAVTKEQVKHLVEEKKRIDEERARLQAE